MAVETPDKETERPVRKSRGPSKPRGKPSAQVPAAEAVEQLRQVTSFLTKTSHGEGAPYVACVQAAATVDLVKHSDREVRLWAAKCLAEGLRIFAPEPPLDKEQLRSALELFLEQLTVLAEPHHRCYIHAFSLLERLVEVCAFMLIFECGDHCDALLVKTVRVCLSAARASEGGTLESLLTKTLTSVLGEADAIPAAAVMELVEELAPKRQQKCVAGLVRQILASLAGHSAAVLSINSFLNAALYGQSEGGVGLEGLETAFGREGNAALFCTVYELFAIDPALVSRVLPNLHVDLTSDNAERRCAATTWVGRMLALQNPVGPRTRAPLVSTHPLLLDCCLERLADAEEDVRLAALEGAAALLAAIITLSSGGGKAQGSIAVLDAADVLRQKLLERCLDPSDAVRLSVVKVVAGAAGSAAGLKILSPILAEVFRRILDKRNSIRTACALAAAELYAQHDLPLCTKEEGSLGGERELSWVPQLLMEAFSVFASNHLGQTALIEELVEQHLLGCGGGLSAQERAWALVGFCLAAATAEGPKQGLTLLLRRKAEANLALRRYLQFRRHLQGPSFKSPQALCTVEASAAAAPAAAAAAAATAAAAALERLGRCSPAMDDRNFRFESLLVHLRAVDAVRDKALWMQLDLLSSPTALHATDDLEPALLELDRLLRVHRLTDLAPLFRRSFLCTWLLPDQVLTLLEVCGDDGQPLLSPQPGQDASRLIVVTLSRAFPGAFLSHTEAILPQLQASAKTKVDAALRVLGALGKRLGTKQRPGLDQWLADFPLPELDGAEFVATVVKAAARIGEAGQDAVLCSSLCRKAVRACALVPAASAETLCRALLQAEAERLPKPLLLQLAAACYEQFPQEESNQFFGRWQDESQQILQEANCHQLSCLILAVLKLCTTSGAEESFTAFLEKANQERVRLPIYVLLSALRALRHGTLPLTTNLLANMATQLHSVLEMDNVDSGVERVMAELQKLQKPSKTTALRLADRLRLCSSLPAIFAFAQLKKHRDVMAKNFQALLLGVSQQCAARQEPLLDFAIACFLHFLSRLELFGNEVGAAVSAYPQSTKLATFFCDSLVRSDPARSTELAGVALRVCERMPAFVDREEPSSERLQSAAHVLRYAVEKRCPELGAHGAGLLGTSRGSVPAQLFQLRSEAESSGAQRPAALGPPQAAISEGSETAKKRRRQK